MHFYRPLRAAAALQREIKIVVLVLLEATKPATARKDRPMSTEQSKLSVVRMAWLRALRHLRYVNFAEGLTSRRGASDLGLVFS
jgi:hypothetical protein